MNVVKSASKSRDQTPNKATSPSGISSNAHVIQLYQDIPQSQVSLDDFEESALARLKVRVSFYCIVLCYAIRCYAMLPSVLYTVLLADQFIIVLHILLL
jgi:hypothetical protein